MHRLPWSGLPAAESEALRAGLADLYLRLFEANPLPAGLKSHVLERSLEPGAATRLLGWLGVAPALRGEPPGCAPHEEILVRLLPAWQGDDARSRERQAVFRRAAGSAFDAWLALAAFAAAARVAWAASLPVEVPA